MSKGFTIFVTTFSILLIIIGIYYDTKNNDMREKCVHEQCQKACLNYGGTFSKVIYNNKTDIPNWVDCFCIGKREYPDLIEYRNVHLPLDKNEVIKICSK